MGRYEKLLRDIENNPSDVTFEDLQTLLVKVALRLFRDFIWNLQRHWNVSAASGRCGFITEVRKNRSCTRWNPRAGIISSKKTSCRR